MSGLEPKEQWLCIPHSEPGGIPGIQTRGEKTHKNDNKLQQDFSSCSISQRRKVLSVQQISSRSCCFFFFFALLSIDSVGKWSAFIVWALANALYFIDELSVNFIMHLKESRRPKQAAFREVFYVYSLGAEYYKQFIRMKTIHNSAVQSITFLLDALLLSLHSKSCCNFFVCAAMALFHTEGTVSLL